MSINLEKLRQNIDAIEDAPLMCKPEIAQAALENAYAALKNVTERVAVLEAMMRGANV